jgi:hypothetical protein
MIIANISLRLERYNMTEDKISLKQEKFRNFSVGLMVDSYLIDQKIQDILDQF